MTAPTDGADGGGPDAATDAWEPVPGPRVGERRRPGFLAGDLWLIVDALFLVPLMLFSVLAGPADPDAEVGLDPETFETFLVVGELFTLLLLAGLPVLWLATTRVGGLRGAMVYLRMSPPTKRRWPFHLGVAALAVPAALAFVFGYSALLSALSVDMAGDPFFEELATTVSWPSVVLVALVAGVGEEVLFRGVLQRYVGVLGQAALFTVVHVNQGFAVLPFIAVVALAFGYAVRRGAPLWAVMFTHTVYDLTLFGMLKLGGS